MTDRRSADTWTVQRHVDGKPPDIVALYHRFIELVESCGPFTYTVAKTAIALKGERRGFASIVIGGKSLDGTIDLQRAADDPRIRRAAPYTKRLIVNYFRITDPAQLDDGFAALLREAYAVGQGAHLHR
jgi:hypothetical protein